MSPALCLVDGYCITCRCFTEDCNSSWLLLCFSVCTIFSMILWTLVLPSRLRYCLVFLWGYFVKARFSFSIKGNKGLTWLQSRSQTFVLLLYLFFCDIWLWVWSISVKNTEEVPCYSIVKRFLSSQIMNCCFFHNQMMVKIKKERGSAATVQIRANKVWFKKRRKQKKKGQTLPDQPMAWITNWLHPARIKGHQFYIHP